MVLIYKWLKYLHKVENSLEMKSINEIFKAFSFGQLPFRLLFEAFKVIDEIDACAKLI